MAVNLPSTRTINLNNWIASGDGKIYGKNPLGDRIGGYTPPAGDLITVDFESGDMTTYTNSDGFFFGDGASKASPGLINNQTSIVTQTADTAWCTTNNEPYAIYNNNQVCNGPKVPAGGGDYLAYNGDFCLRFIYHAGTNEWAEQRYCLGTSRDELWIRYWIKVPTNYTHRSGYGDPKKFMALWMDNYSYSGDPDQGATILWELYNEGGTGSKMIIGWNDNANQTVGGNPRNFTVNNFLTEADQDKWMEVTYHIKCATNASSYDGVLQLWRRWDGETTPTQLVDVSDAGFVPPANASLDGWYRGYLLGYDNGGYAAETEWFIDDFVLSSASTPLIV